MEPVRSDLAGEDRGTIGIEHDETDDVLSGLRGGHHPSR